MDQGDNNPSQHEDSSNYNLYDPYDTGMDDDVVLVGGGGGSGAASETGGFSLGGGWDHHHQHSVDEVVGYPHETTGYDQSTTPMDDFGATHYGHEFQHGQPFDHHDGHHHQFQDFMVPNDDQHHPGNEGFDMNSMDLYNASPIYPNLTQEHGDFG